MNYFETLSQYTIPVKTLNQMLKVYKLIGQNDMVMEQLKEKEEVLFENAVMKDTYFIGELLKLNVTDNRKRLIITKDSNPRNEDERALAAIKSVLKTIRSDSQTYPFNGSDIMDYLNKIFTKKKIKFKTTLFEPVNKTIRHQPISIRLMYETMLSDYHKAIKGNEFEPLHLSTLAYLQYCCLKPYTAYNEVGEIFILYYMLLQNEIYSFKYLSFMEVYLKYQEKLIFEREKASINYPEGRFIMTEIMETMFNLITESYNQLSIILKDNVKKDSSFKGESLEKYILQQIPCGATFTKEDIRKKFPEVSESTLNRALTNLKEEGIIEIIGIGRSARWIKVIPDDDPRALFGKLYASE